MNTRKQFRRHIMHVDLRPTMVRMLPATHRRLKLLAQSRRCSMNWLLNDILDDYCDRNCLPEYDGNGQPPA